MLRGVVRCRRDTPAPTWPAHTEIERTYPDEQDEHSPLDQYWAALDAALLTFSAEEQRVAVTLYRELAKGRPVDAAQLGRALGTSAAESRAWLERDSIKAFVYPDEQGRVVGFGGLTAAPTHHRLDLDHRTLWTWCAWDSLFIPEILGERVRVTSPDPETGEPVHLVVTPEEIEFADAGRALVSFLLPAQDLVSSAANVIATFCHYVFLFASQSSGERWVAKHPGTFLYSLDDAFELAKRRNASCFGLELARRQTAAA